MSNLNPNTAAATCTFPGATTASALLVPASANRRGGIIYNTAAAALYIKFDTGASVSSFTQVVGAASGSFNIPEGYSGPIYAALASGTGQVNVTVW